MNDCDYPGCYMTGSRTVRGKRLCPGHAGEYEAFLIYHKWHTEFTAAAIMRESRAIMRETRAALDSPKPSAT